MSDKAATIKALASLKNLGPVSAELLYRFGIRTPEEVLEADAYELFAQLEDFSATPVSRNLLRAILGAQQGLHFSKIDLSAREGSQEGEADDQDLESLRNIGPTMADHLIRVGVDSVSAFKQSDIGEIYREMQRVIGKKICNPHRRALRGAFLDIDWNDPRTKTTVAGESVSVEES